MPFKSTLFGGYCAPWRKWLIWDGQRWAVDDRLGIDSLVKEHQHSLWDVFNAGDRENKDAYNFIRASNGAVGIGHVVALARSGPGIPIHPAKLDTDPFLLNAANGTTVARWPGDVAQNIRR